jgi:hypothetical protein
MEQQAVDERWDWAGDIMAAGLYYSVLILVVMLLCVYVPA